MELHRKVNWRISAIQNICCNVGRPTCQTFVFIFKVREVRHFKCISKLPFWACDTVCHISGWLNYLQMDGADEAMDTILMIIISCSTITAQTCELYSLLMPYDGRYCPGDGTVILRSVPHLCRSVTNLYGLQLQRQWQNMYPFKVPMSRNLRAPCYGVCGFHTEAIQTVLYMGNI